MKVDQKGGRSLVEVYGHYREPDLRRVYDSGVVELLKDAARKIHQSGNPTAIVVERTEVHDYAYEWNGFVALFWQDPEMQGSEEYYAVFVNGRPRPGSQWPVSVLFSGTPARPDLPTLLVEDRVAVRMGFPDESYLRDGEVKEVFQPTWQNVSLKEQIAIAIQEARPITEYKHRGENLQFSSRETPYAEALSEATLSGRSGEQLFRRVFPEAV